VCTRFVTSGKGDRKNDGKGAAGSRATGSVLDGPFNAGLESLALIPALFSAENLNEIRSLFGEA
jgi:hypothetical protein